MKILITGSSGFIGFSLSKFLLEKGLLVYGIDNMNSYYNLKLKKKRLSILKTFRNFKFYKIDISNKVQFYSFFKKKKIDLIINLAAQPGVRYSMIDPHSYFQNNIMGFANILEIVKEKKIPLIYSSSSSVYGNSKKFPIKENHELNPINIYALTKKTNEEMAQHYCNNFNIKALGLRFFTVFGEWGRPDMLIIKFLISSIKGKTFEVYNHGNHYRDFTYINDLCEMIFPLITNYKKINNKNIIFNVCTGKSLHLKYIINRLKLFTDYKKVVFKKYNSLEVLKTHGSNNKILKYTRKNIKFTNINTSLKYTYDWFVKNRNIFE
jgi:UDP-glucuronate 4-epimerase